MIKSVNRYFNSQVLKLTGCYDLRFKKQYDLVCTELATVLGSADIFGVDLKKQKTIEIETKISMSDFYADFKKSKWLNPGGPLWPNYFYFLVPHEMREKCIKFLIDKKISAGVCCPVNDFEVTWYLRPKENKESVFPQDIIKTMSRRLTSENFYIRSALFNIKHPERFFQQNNPGWTESDYEKFLRG